MDTFSIIVLICAAIIFVLLVKLFKFIMPLIGLVVSVYLLYFSFSNASILSWFSPETLIMFQLGCLIVMAISIVSFFGGIVTTFVVVLLFVCAAFFVASLDAKDGWQWTKYITENTAQIQPHLNDLKKGVNDLLATAATVPTTPVPAPTSAIPPATPPTVQSCPVGSVVNGRSPPVPFQQVEKLCDLIPKIACHEGCPYRPMGCDLSQIRIDYQDGQRMVTMQGNFESIEGKCK